MLSSKHAYYWNGVAWTDTGAIPTASTTPRIWGNGASSAIVVGDDVYRWDGVAWAKLPFAKSDFFAVGHGTNAARVVILRDDNVAKQPGVVLWNGGTALYPIDTGTLYPPSSKPAQQAFSVEVCVRRRYGVGHPRRPELRRDEAAVCAPRQLLGRGRRRMARPSAGLHRHLEHGPSHRREAEERAAVRSRRDLPVTQSRPRA